MSSSAYVDKERRDYSLYILQSRSIPHAADGLKAAARRILWIGKDGKKYKSATLAGATMCLHPHGTPEGTVNTLAAPYGNNIPLLDGMGAFGTLLNPTAYGASRYTSVKISQFTKDVVFRDIEIIPMQENYDGTLNEPVHFLPLVPIVLLNPQEGIAVGFATNILPRALDDIINSQIEYLGKRGKSNTECEPTFAPTNQRAHEQTTDKEGRIRYLFRGEWEKVNTSTLRIVNLPYGTAHKKYIDYLTHLDEEGTIVSFEDNSRDKYDIVVKFKRGQLKHLTDDNIVALLKLSTSVTENMTMIDFDGQRVLKTDYKTFIQMFCDWRLNWYVQRYKLLARNLEDNIQRYKDVLRAIARNVGGIAKKVRTRGELKEFLEEIEIINVDYIADLSVYRFTQEEKAKAERKVKEGEAILKEYKAILNSQAKRKAIFVEELKVVLSKYKRGEYT